jgi:hypothetical protein
VCQLLKCLLGCAFDKTAAMLQVKAASKKKDLNLKFHGAKDHLDDSMHEYKVSLLR